MQVEAGTLNNSEYASVAPCLLPLCLATSGAKQQKLVPALSKYPGIEVAGSLTPPQAAAANVPLDFHLNPQSHSSFQSLRACVGFPVETGDGWGPLKAAIKVAKSLRPSNGPSKHTRNTRGTLIGRVFSDLCVIRKLLVQPPVSPSADESHLSFSA